MVSSESCPICVKSPIEQQDNIHSIKWIQCGKCGQWFHSICVNLSPDVEESLHSYHCASCSKKHGQSVVKRKSKRARVLVDYVALDSGEAYAIDKTQHPHLPKFFDFATVADTSNTDKINEHVVVTDTLSKELAFSTRMTKPIYIPQADLARNGMALPVDKLELTIDYITDSVGDDTPVEVMDVLTQQGVKPGWNMGQWRDYFKLPQGSRDRLRNVITLEISSYEDLGAKFTRPKFVEELDLVDKVWHQHDEQQRPQITKYCLMSVRGSFTDFHIDFGGTSVYYTVCSGSKTFLMFPPSDENLQLYESWCLEPEQNYTWFANYSKFVNRKKIYPTNGFKVTLSPGDLFIIPSGWIHCVYTPQDSIVIGGNFITLNDMPTQLKIVDLEKRTKVPQKFRFPMFNKVLWYTSWYYYNHQDEFLQDITNDDECNGQRILALLIERLKQHLELSKTNQTAKRSIPTDFIGRNVIDYIVRLEAWLAQFDNKHQIKVEAMSAHG